MTNQPSDPSLESSSSTNAAEPNVTESAEAAEAKRLEASENEATETEAVAGESTGADTVGDSVAPQVAASTSSDPVPGAEVTAASDAAPATSDIPATPAEPVAADASEPVAESAEEKQRVAIGTQREGAGDGPVKPKAVSDAESKPIPAADSLPGGPVDTSKNKPHVPKNTGPIPVPSKRNSSDDIESELAKTMGDVNLDSVMQDSSTGEAASEDIEIGGRYKGTVTRIHNDDIFFTLKGRFEGVASKRSFKKEPEVGSMTDIVVKGFNEEDGIYEVSVPGTSVSVEDWSDLQVGTVVEARVTGSNTGGLECVVNSIRGFIPASQIALHRVENLGDYVNKKLSCVVTEAKPKRKNLVLSHRKVLEKEMAEVRKESMAKLEVNSVVEGKVTRIREFGAFVDIGGVEGLVHISKLSWSRIEKPTEVVNEGDSIKVKIEKINPESGKIALSLRDTVTHPWEGIEDKYPANSTVKGTVTRLAAFGAFVRLEPGVEGLVHISELAHHRVVAVKNVVKEGDEIEVKVLSVDRPSQKIGLSLKATIPAPEKPEKGAKEEINEAPRELAVRARRKPLKGGTDRKSGGESFGLKW